jgi:hypothetical protein
MAALTVLAVLASVFTLASPAQAADAIPATQWSASIDNNPLLFAGPSGSVTVGCATYGTNSNLRTYSSTGALTRNIPNTVLIDGVKNCIQRPAIGKDGSIYGTPLNGPNMLAYNTGITLKWKYPTSTCGDSPPEIGADGNIYMITSLSDGVHLIGLTPEVETGKTQPAKVFDVKVPSCGVIQSYKYGIALKIGMDGVRYYSYSGKYIGQASVKDNYTPKEAIDDWGRVFVPLSSQTATARISMYNPNKNAIGWTYSLIPKTIIKELRPVTGGGVAALVVQPVMVASPTPGAPDVPASPARDEKVIIVISPQGTKQRTIPVPDFDARGDEYTSETFAVDGGTKVVVARTLAVKTGRTDPEYLNGTFIGAYDITSGTWSYQTVMKGDAAKTGGASNYVFQPTNENTSDMLLSSGTVGIVAGCTGNCASYSPKLYMVKVAGVNMENPRWNVTNTGPKTASSSIALGGSPAFRGGIRHR